MASSDPWFHSKAFLSSVQNFHDKFARQPIDQITEAKQLHTMYTGEIERQLRKQGICVRIEYTGSSYEGTKVAKSPGNYDLEFDIMVIIDCRKSQVQVEKLSDLPGFAQLKLKKTTADGVDAFGVVEGGYLNAEKTARKFFGVLQKLIDDSELLKRKVKLRSHGPAAQMDVSKRDNDSTVFYSVDVVPTYETSTQERYVAKPVKPGEASTNPLAWRRSFSIEEKAKLVAGDRDNGCRKKVFRILKVIRNRETCLAPMTSYHLKTALFLEMDETSDWKEERLGQRLMGVFAQLEKRLDGGNLPHYFLKKDVNLLRSMSDSSVANMKDRLRRFRNSEIEMNRILKVN